MRRPLLLLLLALGFAYGQQGDPFLGSYRRALDALKASTERFADDPVESFDALQRAQRELPTLTEGGSRALRRGLTATLARAKQAVVNESPTDLAVQGAVLAGGLQRLAYERALRQAAGGERGRARALLQALATDLGLPPGDLTGADTALRPAFEAGLAEVILAQLDAARAAEDQNAAYRALARAYGQFVLIQDSPRLPASTGGALMGAVQALVGDDTAAFRARLERARSGLQTLAERARAARTASPAPSTPAPQANAAPTPAERLTELSALTEAAPPLEPAPDPAEADEGETDIPQPDALERDLERYPLPPEVAASLRAAYEAGGYEGVEEALDALYAQSARTLAAAQRGDGARARASVSAFETTFELLAPLLNAPELVQGTHALTDTLQAAPVLGVPEALALTAQAEVVGRALEGTPDRPIPSIPDIFIPDASRVWLGLPRLVTLIALGLLALVALVRLGARSRGGGAPPLLAGALALLLLPVLFEGLLTLGAVLAPLTGLEVLGRLAPYALFGGPLTGLLGALLVFFALLATLGGAGSGREALRAPEPTPRPEPPPPAGDLDWDEEF